MQAVRLIVAAVLFCALVGCGNSSSEGSGDGSPASNVSKPNTATGDAAVEGKAGGRAVESGDPNVPAGR